MMRLGIICCLLCIVPWPLAAGPSTPAGDPNAGAIAAVDINDAARRAGDVFRDCADCPEMVVLSAGSFQMGSAETETQKFGVPFHYASRERPQRQVSIVHRLAVGKLEITRGQFARFVAERGDREAGECYYFNGKWSKDTANDWRTPGYRQADDHPVVCVNWHDATAYAKWLAQLSGRAYRLLSEAEWEYAARGGSDKARYWGDDIENRTGCKAANVPSADLREDMPWLTWPLFDCHDGAPYTAAVGRYRANRFGLHDMLGNVLEWVADCWHATYEAAPRDGTARSQAGCRRHVVRGGSWGSAPADLRAAARTRFDVNARSSNLGFRVARPLR